MKKLKVSFAMVVVALTAFVLTPSAVAETIEKAKAGPLVHVNRPSALVGFSAGNAVAVAAALPSIDLNGGKYDKISYGVYITSAAGAGTLTWTLSISPDGGTSWIPKDTQTMLANGTTPLTSSYHNLTVQPGTKARLIPTVTTGATFYGMKAWVMPSVD